MHVLFIDPKLALEAVDSTMTKDTLEMVGLISSSEWEVINFLNAKKNKKRMFAFHQRITFCITICIIIIIITVFNIIFINTFIMLLLHLWLFSSIYFSAIQIDFQ